MRHIRRVEKARRERAHILECEREDFGRRHWGRRRADVGIGAGTGARELGHGYGCARREELQVGHRPVLPQHVSAVEHVVVVVSAGGKRSRADNVKVKPNVGACISSNLQLISYPSRESRGVLKKAMIHRSRSLSVQAHLNCGPGSFPFGDTESESGVRVTNTKYEGPRRGRYNFRADPHQKLA